MSNINLKSLRVFSAVAKHLNFRIAAEELHVTRGAVAQQIRQLEDDLGIKLFNRLPRGLSLTTKAEEYYAVIRQAFEMIDNATRSISTTTNRVVVTMTPTMAAKWLLPRLNDFENQYPNIDLQIVTSDNLTDFDSEGVDVAIRYGNPDSEKLLVTEHLINLSLLAVCSPAYAKKHCAEYAVDDTFSRYCVKNLETFFIHRLVQGKHRYWDTWLQSMKIPEAERVLVFNQTSLSIDAAMNGQGITMVEKILVMDHLKRGELVTLWEHNNVDNQGYYLAYQQDEKPMQTSVIAVLEWLRDSLIKSIEA